MTPLYGLAFALASFTSLAAAEVDQLLQQADDECLSTLQLRGEYRLQDPAIPLPRIDWGHDLKISPCPKASSRPCIAGFRQPVECRRNFTYGGKEYGGCTQDGAVTGKQWCSRDSEHTSWSHWERCISCTEEAKLPLQVWEGVLDKLRCMKFSMIIGSAKGVTFRFENNQDVLRKPFPIFSAGKWPAVVAIAGTVRDGFLDWDTRARDVFDWWLNSPGDNRSNITLRHLLQFNSGFKAHFIELHGMEMPCLNLPAATLFSTEDCARQIYEHADHPYEPGTNFTYNGYHLEIAMAMAAKASSKTSVQLLNDNLFKPVGMHNTSVGGGQNPILDAFMFSTGDDYARFLEKLLNYEILPKEICDVLEAPAGKEYEPLFSMGHWTNGTDQHWGGTLFAHLNRKTGVYAVLIPKLIDYAAYIPPVDGAPNPLEGQYLGAGRHVWDWIEADVESLGALDHLGAL